MPECENCGAFLSEDYARVFLPSGESAAPACPHCPNMVREGADYRPARSHAGRANEGGRAQ